MSRQRPTANDSILYDITPAISDGLRVWPGDTPPAREVLLDMRRGDAITLSTLRTTVHLGAHADAPSHYGRDAPTIDRRPLDLYLGRCQVIRVPVEHGAIITPEAIAGREVVAPRVLFHTGTFPDWTAFPEDFAALTPELVDSLADRGVRLIGIDTPSVDRFDSKDLPTHHAFLRRDLAILEGLVLEAVPEGLYELIALPLHLIGFDASPVRAVLRTLPG